MLIYLKNMNSLFDRLGDMLKDYIEDDQDIFSKPSDEKEADNKQADKTAETEVEDSDAEPDTDDNNKTDSQHTSQTTNNMYETKRKTFTFNTQNQQRTSFTKKADKDYTIYKAPKPVPPQIRKDFDFFGLSLNASLNDCKAVYKKLLKVYHPDKHSADPVKLKTATEYSARVNTAYKRLVEWLTAERTVKG